jgi:putative aldouronate transport system permease protein
MAVLCAVTLYPFMVIVGSSLQSTVDLTRNGYSIIPEHLDLTAYSMILANPGQLARSYWVSIYTTLATVVIGLYLTATCGYVMSRKDYAYKRFLSIYVFFTMLFNGGLVPTYILYVNWLHLKNSPIALVLPMVVSAWYILLMKSFMVKIPVSLVECATIDGAGEWRIFYQIIIPLTKPAIATVGLFFCLGSWNDWWLSLLFIEDDRYVKLQYLLQRLLKYIEYLNTPEAQQMGATLGIRIPTQASRMAMCVLATGPMLFVFPFFQRYFVRGITVGSIKE